MGGTGRHKLVVTTPSETEIVMTRVFDAPRELVFEAHTSCEHLSRWWGPRAYETVACEVDFRTGGSWRIVHRGPDGDEIAFFGDYLEIVRPERIVWTFAFEGLTGQEGLSGGPAPETMTFEERDGTTTITTTSVFPSAEVRDLVLESGMEEGAVETYERLDEYLVTLRERAAG
ncbi:MAG TPA: SRPBCC family protein [Actinomycetota bacterium]|nr:SRPBCC family protein [Actinomycetota bacterium]